MLFVIHSSICIKHGLHGRLDDQSRWRGFNISRGESFEISLEGIANARELSLGMRLVFRTMSVWVPSGQKNLLCSLHMVDVSWVKLLVWRVGVVELGHLVPDNADGGRGNGESGPHGVKFTGIERGMALL